MLFSEEGIIHRNIIHLPTIVSEKRKKIYPDYIMSV